MCFTYLLSYFPVSNSFLAESVFIIWMGLCLREYVWKKAQLTWEIDLLVEIWEVDAMV